MALRWFDGFDWANGGSTNGVLYGYDSGIFNSQITGSRNGSRFAGTGNGSLGKTFDNQQTWIFGWALKTSNLPGSASQPIWIAFMDGSSRQLAICHTSGSLRVLRGGTFAGDSGGTSIVTGPTMVADRWYHMAVKVVIANSGGRVIVKLNNQTVIDFTGDTQETANAYANAINFGGISDGQTTFFDDVYIFDSTGSNNNDFPADADLRVRFLPPSGNGNYSQFDGSDGNSTDNYLLVDELGGNTPTDTDYVSTSTAGEKDTYTHDDMPTNSTVYGVSHKIVIRKDDAGSRTAKSIVRLGGTDYEGPALTVGDAYLGTERVMEVNPNTSALWTPTEVNAIDSGIKLES